MFPIDPRDFIGNIAGDSTTCLANEIVPTDPPSRSIPYQWSLGDPFFKSNLVAFHYGNLTHTSVNPPRMGFMSVVPADAEQLQDAVAKAQINGGNFEYTVNLAPTASVATASEITLTNPSPGLTPVTNAPQAAVTTLSLGNTSQVPQKSAGSASRRITVRKEISFRRDSRRTNSCNPIPRLAVFHCLYQEPITLYLMMFKGI
ncbi:hypothetical protein BD779DRAFT_1122359 [Infundibulicybe gibba]|nr:hypothetical protein BD779DRAFT_1122359 [Infundibulicybe gibba]